MARPVSALPADAPSREHRRSLTTKDQGFPYHIFLLKNAATSAHRNCPQKKVLKVERPPERRPHGAADRRALCSSGRARPARESHVRGSYNSFNSFPFSRISRSSGIWFEIIFWQHKCHFSTHEMFKSQIILTYLFPGARPSVLTQWLWDNRTSLWAS